MTKIQGLDLTAEQLRLQVADFVVVFGGMVERGADEIIENSDSPKAKENALLWKANAIPVCQMAAFQFDPMVGLLDLWAFSSQMTEFFENGKGAHLRRSTSMSLAALDKDKGLSEVLGGMDERMTDMATRMNIMMRQMPKNGLDRYRPCPSASVHPRPHGDLGRLG
ncbi:MAG: hypothetical protein K8R69_10525 [Deltaproteobacteria bacterium]|nr:hypothetical protein [Deltaproteobacteria bacterium]